MANDIRVLMTALGIERAPIIGHNRDARVGLRFAKDHPDATDRFAALDNVPTRVIFERMDAKVVRGHWFFLFNAVRDPPEALITGREELWLRFIFSGWTYDPQALTNEDITTYTRAYAQHGGLRDALEDYRGRGGCEAGPGRCQRQADLPDARAMGRAFRVRIFPARRNTSSRPSCPARCSPTSCPATPCRRHSATA